MKEEFLEKLSRDITAAKDQMDAYNPDARKIAYVVINFDDWVGDYTEEHLAQIEHFFRHTLRPGVDLVADVRTSFLTKITLYGEAG